MFSYFLPFQENHLRRQFAWNVLFSFLGGENKENITFYLLNTGVGGLGGWWGWGGILKIKGLMWSVILGKTGGSYHLLCTFSWSVQLLWLKTSVWPDSVEVLTRFLFVYNVHCKKRDLNPCHAEYIKMLCPFLIVSQSDCLIQVVDINSHTEWQTVQKLADLDLHCLQRQDISRFSRTRVKGNGYTFRGDNSKCLVHLSTVLNVSCCDGSVSVIPRAVSTICFKWQLLLHPWG